mgnify:CR=1 FL=1
MVPDVPSLSRRQFLGGLAGGVGLAGAGTAVIGSAAPTVLPDVVTDWWVAHAATPPSARSLWQPTVTEAHAREAVDLLADTTEESTDRWERIDSDRMGTHGAGGWLETARDELESGNYHAALSDATYGLQFAGESLGEARSKLDKADLGANAERAMALLDRVDAVVADIEGRPVSDPQRDLAWYTHIESELQRARMLADWHGLDAVRQEGADTVSSGDIADVETIVRDLLLAEIAVENAERYRTRLFEKLRDEMTNYVPHLRNTADELRNSLEGIPSSEEVRSRYLGDNPESYGPYEFAHARLARWCFPGSGPDPFRTAVDETFHVLSILGLAKGLGQWRAHESVVETMVIGPDDDGLDSGHVLAEKRRAQSTFESVVGPDPAPFFTVLVDRAIEDIRVADIDRDWDGNWKPWNERIQAYLYALLGRTKLDVYPDIYDDVLAVDGSNRL